MGFNTKVDGTLTFVQPTSAVLFAKLTEMLGEDTRDHPEWPYIDGEDYSYLQWVINKQFTGLEYDGNEKFYCIPQSINLIVREMRKTFPDFDFDGILYCITDDGEHYRIEKRDGVFVEVRE